jgi:hypothetical protein
MLQQQVAKQPVPALVITPMWLMTSFTEVKANKNLASYSFEAQNHISALKGITKSRLKLWLGTTQTTQLGH